MGAVQSPLFEPVLWQDGGFRILDEIQVPQKLEYIEVTEVEQALDAVREMKTRAFGQVLTFLYAGALLAERAGDQPAAWLRPRLAQMTQQFCEARPTFDFRGLGRYFDQWIDQLRADAPAGATIAKQAREFGKQIVRGRSGRAKRAAELLPNPTRLLTHCNVSGELVAVAAFCNALGKEFSVIATETRPYLQGSRLTAWELAQAGVEVSLIPDCAIAQVMAKGEVNVVIVGADRTAQNGDIINKVGTYPIARLAKEYKVPFNVLVQDPRGLRRGRDVPIEERPADELLKFHGAALVGGNIDALKVRYPSFDMVPSALISHLIGFEGVYTPETFAIKYQSQTSNESFPRTAAKYLLLYGVPAQDQYPVLTEALRSDKVESLLVPEMRPQLWGAQVVARALLDRGASTTLISDNMMGTLFARGEIGRLCLFYDALDEKGPLGIPGSLLAAQLAHLHGVPIALFGAAATPTRHLDNDASTFMGINICSPRVSIRPVETEVIPWSLVRN